MSIAWNGQKREIPCVRTLSYLDAGGPPRSPNCYTTDPKGPGSKNHAMVQTITGCVWHTVTGEANGTIAPPSACVDADGLQGYIKEFMRPARNASSTVLISGMGLVYNILDMVTDRSWSAGQVNPFTISVEMLALKKTNPGSMCQATIDAAVQFAWWVCRTFGIQAMIPVTSSGDIDFEDIRDWDTTGAKDFYGHYFHANLWSPKPQGERGRGDPGPAFPRAFLASGAEGFDVRHGQDKDVWKQRQAQLGMPAAQQDGIAGPLTVAAIQQRYGRPTWAIQNNLCGAAVAGGGMSGGSGAMMLMLAALGAWAATR